MDITITAYEKDKKALAPTDPPRIYDEWVFADAYNELRKTKACPSYLTREMFNKIQVEKNIKLKCIAKEDRKIRLAGKLTDYFTEEDIKTWGLTSKDRHLNTKAN